MTKAKRIYSKVVQTRNYENLITYLGEELGQALYDAVDELKRLDIAKTKAKGKTRKK